MVELKYLYHGTELPEGWELAGSLRGTHHYHYASHIIRRKLCPFCGQPENLQQIHGFGQIAVNLVLAFFQAIGKEKIGQEKNKC